MRRRTLVNVLLVLGSVAIFALALALGSSRGEFGGTDDSATEAIAQSDPAYTPWFNPVWEPAGGEVESGLFALQAALGAGLVGFALGTYRERRRRGGPAPAPARQPVASGSD